MVNKDSKILYLNLKNKIISEQQSYKSNVLRHLEIFIDSKKDKPKVELNQRTGEKKCDHYGNTHKRYRSFFDRFIKRYGNFNSSALMNWRRDIINSDKKNSTYNNELILLKQFSDYLFEMNVTDKKIVNGHLLKYKKTNDQENYPVLDKKDLLYLLNLESKDKILNYIKFALASGLRAQELVDLPKFKFNKKERWLVVKGKGGNKRILHLSEDLLNLRSKILKDKFITTNYMSKRLNKFLKKHNIKRYSFHSFRATFATSLYNFGVNIEKVSKILGHKSIDTTKKYIRSLRDNAPVEIINPYSK
jgi:site-specific recombinase XerD